MIEQPPGSAPLPGKPFPFLAAGALILAVFGCSIYANLSFAITNPADFRYFPPFKPHVNRNDNRHLGAEYFNIAKSLVAGEGFSNPFPGKTGPTAWMPPLLPGLEAGLLWLCAGDKDTVMAVVIFFQVYSLIVTGLLVLLLIRQTGRWVGAWVAAAVFFLGLLCNFHSCFQVTHDTWFVLLTIDLLVAGLCWLRPLNSFGMAAGWGLFGGFCALVNPILGLVWAIMTFAVALPRRAWSRLGFAALVAALALAPWTVRNYLVFGRFIPVKSNLAYELYQSQCLQPDGLIQVKTFATHPYASGGRERKEYREMGEIAFLDRKRAQFWEAVRADPLEFVDRAACRFLGATLWYIPFDRQSETKRPVAFWISRLTHPLPFLALLVLLCTALLERLQPAQWVVIGAYLLYLFPYIGASYYERYAIPLLGVKALLVLWAADRLLSLWPRRQAPARQPVGPVQPLKVDVARKAVPREQGKPNPVRRSGSLSRKERNARLHGQGADQSVLSTEY